MLEDINMNDRERLAGYACRFQGDWKQIQHAWMHNIDTDETPADPFITILDKEYPPQLKQLQYAPWVLFYEGDITLLQKRMITLVGTRKPSVQGAQAAIAITSRLSRQFVIVSGLAKGVDGICHRTALVHQKPTIGVIAHGLDTVYPMVNQDLYAAMKQQGLILSEFPRGTPVRKYSFPWRNRILAALSEAVIVVQASVHSGTMHTVREALQLGKEIWCVPHPFQQEEGFGCNALIDDGARILYDLDQLQEIEQTKPVENAKRFV